MTEKDEHDISIEDGFDALCVVPSSSNEPSPLSDESWSMSQDDEVMMIGGQRLNLVEQLDDATKYAFCDLVTIILKSDFLTYDINKRFCFDSFELLIGHFKMPPKVCRVLRNHLNGVDYNDDIVPLIITLRQCPFLMKHGCSVLLAELVAMFVETGIYDGRYRVLMRHVSALLAISWDKVENIEESVAHLLIEENYVETEDLVSERKRKERNKKIKRYIMIGASGTIGGVLVGLTGGLAAPFFAAGAGVIVGTGAAAGIATTAGAAVLGSVFGAAGAGLAGYKMKKRVGAIEEFVVETLTDGQSLHCVIAVCGWIEDDNADAFRWPWRHLDISKEQYCLRYESQYLRELGKAMDYLMSFAVSYAIQQTLMETALAGLVSAVVWPVTLLAVASVLDNPWNVCIRRAAEVGHHLAEILLRRQHGQRPVTLVGFSMGARVIYHCLLEMSTRPHFEGIVEEVVLLGAPVTASSKEWRQMCHVVGGRVINGYCKTDWLLKFLYRTMSVQLSIAGTAPVERTGEKKIVNFDVSHIVTGHLDYRHKLSEVLKAVGVRVKPHSSNSYLSLAEAKAANLNRNISTCSLPVQHIETDSLRPSPRTPDPPRRINSQS